VMMIYSVAQVLTNWLTKQLSLLKKPE